MAIELNAAERRLIERYVTRCGISPALRGFDAIVYGLKYRLDRPNTPLVMMELYREVAETLSAAPMHIERRMRHAVTTAFEDTHPDYLAELFDDLTNMHTGKVANTVFIATLEREIRCEWPA